jgi:anti-anti-sigma factor
MNDAWKLDIGREILDGVTVITVAGRLGAGLSGRLLDPLLAALGEGQRRILIDLSGVDYLSSAGLMTLDAAAGRVHEAGGRLALCGLAEPVRLALELSGRLEEFIVADTRADGVATLRG